MAVSPGFRADHVLTGEVTVPFRYNARPFLDRLLEAIGQQPGVAAAGAITNVPLSGESGKTAVTPKGYVPPAGRIIARSLFSIKSRAITSPRSAFLCARAGF